MFKGTKQLMDPAYFKSTSQDVQQIFMTRRGRRSARIKLVYGAGMELV